jgi:hypothetical protein
MVIFQNAYNVSVDKATGGGKPRKQHVNFSIEYLFPLGEHKVERRSMRTSPQTISILNIGTKQVNNRL